MIPVIDLKDGQVVKAVAGNRAQYQPIHTLSKLVSRSDIDAVIDAYLGLYAFKHFYIADLNAISHMGDHEAMIKDTLQHYGNHEFWIDTGCSQHNAKPMTANRKTVLGSESQPNPLKKMNPEQILSLDYRQNNFLGHPTWLTNRDFWPDRLIMMNLDYVGINQGPDCKKLAELAINNPDKQIFAAGGVRHNHDLERLRQIGIQGVLLASALHNGTVQFDNL